MSKVGWRFPLTNGGKEDGYNDPGVAHFAGTHLYSLARETIQNSLDAKKCEDKPVEVIFELIKLSPIEIGSTELGEAISLSKKRASELPDVKAHGALVKAEQILQQANICCLKVSDRNTIGLREKNWQALVKMQGVSQKEQVKGAGGSHGIGKYAPYAVSALRTVFYYTCYEENQGIVEKLQGKAVLMSHDVHGERTQGTGFFGIKEGCSELSDLSNYLELKNLRIIDENGSPAPGTAVTIAGFSEDDNWQRRIESSVIENYFYAISKDNLEILVEPEIGTTQLSGIEISSSNLNLWFNRLLKPEFGNKENEQKGALGRAKIYCELTKGASIKIDKQDSDLGHCSLYIKIGEGLPNRVALVRRSGMLVTDKQTSLLRFPNHKDFAAMCVFEDPTGNEFLRQMENPQHDRFEPDRLPEEERNKGRRVLRRITKWIRDEIRKHAGPPEIGTKTELSELARLLPELDSDEPFDDTSNEYSVGKQEQNFGEAITVKLKPIRKSGLAKSTNDEDDSDSVGHDIGTSGGGSDGTGTAGGAGGSTGFEEGEGRGGTGGKSGGLGKKAVPISAVRLIPLNDTGNHYRLSFNGHSENMCQIAIEEAGDSSFSRIDEIEAVGGLPLDKVPLEEGGRVTIDIVSNTPLHDRAIRVVAFEATEK